MTAVNLTPTEIQRYRDRLKARQTPVSASARLRLAEAHKIAARAARLLRQDFSASRVMLFGSALSPELFHVHSDIDLAAWGVNEREYYRAVGVLQALDPQFPIDLIRFEEASAGLRTAILQTGADL
jgi:predicted nucleotidyltransferase